MSRERHINVTIVSPTSGSVSFSTVPGSAYLGCGPFNVPGKVHTYVQGKDESYTLTILISVVGDTCISRPGTYDFLCQYIKESSDAPQVVYENDSVSDPGSITYTVVREDYVEGHFHAVCKNGLDSVVVDGTFDGYTN